MKAHPPEPSSSFTKRFLLTWRAASDGLGTFCLDHAAEIIETGALVDEFLVTADDAA